MQNARSDRRRRFALPALALAFAVLSSSAAHAQASEAEPNHPCSLAQDLSGLSFPATVSGSLDAPPAVPDVDFYRFAARPGSIVTVRLAGAGPQPVPDTVLGIYDADCATLLGIDDDGGGNLTSFLRITVPASGAFVVAATSYADFGFTGNGFYSGGYTVSVASEELARSVAGRVVDARSGAPLPFAQVELRRCTGGSCFEFAGYTSTDASGAFRFASGDSTVFGAALAVGDYKLVLRAFNHVDGEVGPFHLAADQELELGDVALLPVPTVSSISGRVVDAATHAPLSGAAEPFAFVQLLYCDPLFGGFCYPVRSAPAGAQGGFRFEGSSESPLFAGTYQVTVFANQYVGNFTPLFQVADSEDRNLGDVELKSFPVRLYLGQSCASLPPSGGTCRFTARVVNGMSERFQGQAWSIIQAYEPAGFSNYTTFEVDDPRTLLMAPNASATATFTLPVPADVPDGTYICAHVYAGHKGSNLRALGSHDLFCLFKGYGGFVQVSEERKRELVRSSQGDPRRRRP